MTWLDSDAEKIRKFLGYPVEASALALILSEMGVLASLSPGAVATAQELIRELAKIEQQLRDTRPYAGAASYSTAGSSTDYYAGQRMGTLREEGKRLAGELASMFDKLYVLRDVFAVGGGAGGGSRLVR